MERLSGLIKSQDAFGEQVGINYKGETHFKTWPGATLTLMEKIFILVVAMIGLAELFSFKDPNITQVSSTSLILLISHVRLLML